MKKAININKNIEIIIILAMLSTSNCTNSLNPKDYVADEIASKSCIYIQEIASAYFFETIKNSLNLTSSENSEHGVQESVSILPEYCCECYTHYISKELSKNFTLSELKELSEDKIKLIIAITKIFNKSKNSIATCIEAITQKKYQDYMEFERTLDEKFKSNSDF
ncbi:MAG: hypothetical protein WAT21_00795 [Saprospiraceae bacterium]